MKIDMLRYFVTVSEERSLYAAAKRLFISPQGLSKSVTRLEDELGQQLLVRARDGVRLTEAGERFLVHARDILARYDAMLLDMSAGRAFADLTCPVTVYLSYYFTQMMAGNALGRPVASDVTVVELPFDKLVAKARDVGEHDVVLLDLHMHSIRAHAKELDLVFEPSLATVFGVVCRERSVLSQCAHLHRRQVCHMPMAVNSFREMSQLTKVLFRERPLTNVRLEGTSPRMLLEFAQSSPDAVACFDSLGFWLAQQDPDMPTDGLAFVPFETQEALCFLGFARAADARPSQEARRFKRLLNEQVSQRFGDYCRQYPVASLWRQVAAYA